MTTPTRKTFVIEVDGLKRYVDMPLRICGSREDLKHFAKTLLDACERNFSYGWVDIREPWPLAERARGTQPLSWEAGE